jgi:phosphatidylglycerol:prolipoprotein diacylglycerol transferase
MIFGVLIGGRLGYVLFYNLPYFLRHPLEIVLPFDFSIGVRFVGLHGMSFHGGLVGVLIASWIYSKKHHIGFREIADLFAPVFPLGYTFGRIGNFINGELYGRVTEVPVGMMFPLAPDTRLRHPSQLYEALGEGVFLYLVLWWLRKAALPRGGMLAIYLIGYGTIRLFLEYFREPDAHLGFMLPNITRGQVLCMVMLLAGVVLYRFLYVMDERITGEPS